MYAKLVTGSTPIYALNAMRDIGRLITSTSPSTANLLSFSTSSSYIIDATPAGWTYVGSTNANDQPTISATNPGTMVNNNVSNLCFSAPTLANSSVLKYCVLTQVYTANTTVISTAGAPANTLFALTGAQSATSSGVLTNEGYRPQTNTTGASNHPYGLLAKASSVFHVIANQRHITIIQEATGFQGVWETSQTDLHTAQNIGPFIQVAQTTGLAGYVANTGSMTQNRITPQQNPSDSNTGAWIVFNITNPNTGTNYGTYDVTECSTYGQGQAVVNNGHLAMGMSTILHTNSLSAVGAGVYIIEPVYFNVSKQGYPTQFVTGICPIYYCSPNMGNSGDTVNVQGDTYTFFNASVTGLLLKTS